MKTSIFAKFGVFITLVISGTTLNFANSSEIIDTDSDGYPDILELSGIDRLSFADWFSSIAESQFYGISQDWALEDQDCAGLLRYAFINTLSRHEAYWWNKFLFIPQPRYPSVRAYTYPVPLVSRSIFRVAPGPYRVTDVLDGKMVGRTGVKYLLNFSTLFISRKIEDAQRGDLLFFLRPNIGSYHSMVYLGNRRVVYHTGAKPEDGGEVRLITIETLLKHPDKSFHVLQSNPSFLGVYRWKILD